MALVEGVPWREVLRVFNCNASFNRTDVCRSLWEVVLLLFIELLQQRGSSLRLLQEGLELSELLKFRLHRRYFFFQCVVLLKRDDLFVNGLAYRTLSVPDGLLAISYAQSIARHAVPLGKVLLEVWVITVRRLLFLLDLLFDFQHVGMCAFFLEILLEL